MIRMTTALLFTCLAWCGSALAQGMPVPSTWQNQRNSILTVTSAGPNGQFSGRFVNNAPDFPQCRGQPYAMNGQPISGGGMIMFVVTFPPCNSVTAWRAVFVSANQMETIWQLAYPNPTGTLTIQKGADAFRRTN